MIEHIFEHQKFTPDGKIKIAKGEATFVNDSQKWPEWAADATLQIDEDNDGELDLVYTVLTRDSDQQITLEDLDVTETASFKLVHENHGRPVLILNATDVPIVAPNETQLIALDTDEAGAFLWYGDEGLGLVKTNELAKVSGSQDFTTAMTALRDDIHANERYVATDLTNTLVVLRLAAESPDLTVDLSGEEGISRTSAVASLPWKTATLTLETSATVNTGDVWKVRDGREEIARYTIETDVTNRESLALKLAEAISRNPQQPTNPQYLAIAKSNVIYVMRADKAEMELKTEVVRRQVEQKDLTIALRDNHVKVENDQTWSLFDGQREIARCLTPVTLVTDGVKLTNPCNGATETAVIDKFVSDLTTNRNYKAAKVSRDLKVTRLDGGAMDLQVVVSANELTLEQLPDRPEGGESWTILDDEMVIASHTFDPESSAPVLTKATLWEELVKDVNQTERYKVNGLAYDPADDPVTCGPGVKNRCDSIRLSRRGEATIPVKLRLDKTAIRHDLSSHPITKQNYPTAKLSFTTQTTPVTGDTWTITDHADNGNVPVLTYEVTDSVATRDELLQKLADHATGVNYVAHVQDDQLFVTRLDGVVPDLQVNVKVPVDTTANTSVPVRGWQIKDQDVKEGQKWKLIDDGQTLTSYPLCDPSSAEEDCPVTGKDDTAKGVRQALLDNFQKDAHVNAGVPIYGLILDSSQTLVLWKHVGGSNFSQEKLEDGTSARDPVSQQAAKLTFGFRVSVAGDLIEITEDKTSSAKVIAAHTLKDGETLGSPLETLAQQIGENSNQLADVVSGPSGGDYLLVREMHHASGRSEATENLEKLSVAVTPISGAISAPSAVVAARVLLPSGWTAAAGDWVLHDGYDELARYPASSGRTTGQISSELEKIVNRDADYRAADEGGYLYVFRSDGLTPRLQLELELAGNSSKFQKEDFAATRVAIGPVERLESGAVWKIRERLTAGEVKEALEELSEVQTVNVSGKGTVEEPWKISFVTTTGPVRQLVVSTGGELPEHLQLYKQTDLTESHRTEHCQHATKLFDSAIGHGSQFQRRESLPPVSLSPLPAVK